MTIPGFGLGRRRQHGLAGGFTLMELLVVIPGPNAPARLP